ncbi:contractile injection system sheath initiator [Streptobacillus canis]|uniref:contractile injection system sheath initiator n=1 Tax=Streptobacillus canis TaxID=2678686 RepID=UPI0012E1210A|nr:hypothetical protein [Streptobacillus canis]
MGILPKILTDTSVESKESKENIKGTSSYIVDFKNKKMKYFNGIPEIDNQELLTKMYIQKLLYTELGKWEFHKTYGTNYKQLTYGKKYTLVDKIRIESNLKEQLLKYDDILAVNELKIIQKNKTLNIRFDVQLKNKKILEWEEEIVND